MADQSQALVVSTQRELLPSTADWQLMQMMADTFAKSGEVSAAKSVYSALVIMQKGRELGIPPMQALSSISVIKGKPATSAELMRALIYRDQGDDALRILVHTNEECRISYKRRSWTDRQECSFTQQDAVAAGLWNGSDVWKKFPAAMLLARRTSIVARAGFPDVIGGMYEENEAKEIPEALEGTVVETDHGSTVKATGEITQLSPRRVTVHEPPPAPATQQQHDRIIELAGELFTTSGVAFDLHPDYTEASARAEIEALEIRVADASIGDLVGLLPTDEQRGKVAACIQAFTEIGRTIEPPPASFTGAEIEGWLTVKRKLLVAERKATANKDRALSYAAAG